MELYEYDLLNRMVYSNAINSIAKGRLGVAKYEFERITNLISGAFDGLLRERNRMIVIQASTDILSNMGRRAEANNSIYKSSIG